MFGALVQDALEEGYDEEQRPAGEGEEASAPDQKVTSVHGGADGSTTVEAHPRPIVTVVT